VKVCVTGATGFIGRAVALELMERGEDVVLFARDRDRAAEIAGGRARIVECDLLDGASVARAVSGCAGVIHCAGVPRPAPLRVFRSIHVDGTAILVDAARVGGVRRLVNVASQTVLFDGRDIDGPEESLEPPARFIDPYSETKAAGERIALGANGSSGLEVTSVRPAVVWGRGDTTLLPSLVRLSTGLVGIPMSGDGTNIEATTHIRNAVRGILAALDGPRAPGRAYLILDAFEIGWNEFLGRLVAASGIEPRFFRVPAFAAAPVAWAIDRAAGALGLPVPLAYFGLRMALTSRRYRATRAREEIGYVPSVGLEEGLADLSAWVSEIGGPRMLALSARPRPGAGRARGEEASRGTARS
jgi:nucleoside-diphosphate-sugar epimerase